MKKNLNNLREEIMNQLNEIRMKYCKRDFGWIETWFK